MTNTKIETRYLKVIQNFPCPGCKENKAETIEVTAYYGYSGFTGINCSCGHKKKANLNKLFFLNQQLKL